MNCSLDVPDTTQLLCSVQLINLHIIHIVLSWNSHRLQELCTHLVFCLEPKGCCVLDVESIRHFSQRWNDRDLLLTQDCIVWVSVKSSSRSNENGAVHVIQELWKFQLQFSLQKLEACPLAIRAAICSGHRKAVGWSSWEPWIVYPQL